MEDILKPAEGVRGTVGDSATHRLEVVRTVDLFGRLCGHVMRERILRDNYCNEYLSYMAALKDREIYEVCDWIRPSVILKYGGWTNALIDAYRAKADRAFASKEAEM